jgi:signal transduction histidine kinase
METAVSFALGFAAALFVAIPVFLTLRRQLAEARSGKAALVDQAETARHILESCPDGFFAWHLNGTTLCSRRLAVLLDLAAGIRATVAEVMARFDGGGREVLEDAVSRLRREGAGFDLALEVLGGRRRVRVLGFRVIGGDDRPLADLLWMRPADEAPAQDDGAAVRALMDALPFPAWLRDENLQVAYLNRACPDGEAAQAMSHSHTVSETPVVGTGLTLGLALERRSEAPAPTGRPEGGVLESLSQAIAIYGADTKLIYFNSAFARLWGLDSAWLAAEPRFAEVLDTLRNQRRLPELADFRAWREQQQRQFQTLTGSLESLMHLPDGRTIRAQVARHPQGGLMFAYEDQSDRLDLERSLKGLGAVQRATLDNLYEGIAVFGADGRLKLSNPAFARLWSLEEEELAAPLHLSAFAARLRSCYADVADWQAEQGRIVARLMAREAHRERLGRDDGRILDYSAVPLPDGAVLLTYLDVTDAARVEQALRDRAQALTEANRLKSEFIANVSYEIRTPLTTIVGFADLLTGGHFGTLNKRQQEYGEGILESARTLLNVVGDILDLAAIEAGMMTLELDAVDVHALLAGVIPLVRERARRKSLEIEFDCASDIGWIVADEKRLRQVLFNLLGNSVEFTRAHGKVAISARRGDGWLDIAVSDTGVGIPFADQERLFNAFERGPALEGQSEGVGLGLALVKRFVELHGGTVELKSSPNRGTTVSFRLPVSGSAAEPQERPQRLKTVPRG